MAPPEAGRLELAEESHSLEAVVCLVLVGRVLEVKRCYSRAAVALVASAGGHQLTALELELARAASSGLGLHQQQGPVVAIEAHPDLVALPLACLA